MYISEGKSRLMLVHKFTNDTLFSVKIHALHIDFGLITRHVQAPCLSLGEWSDISFEKFSVKLSQRSHDMKPFVKQSVICFAWFHWLPPLSACVRQKSRLQ